MEQHYDNSLAVTDAVKSVEGLGEDTEQQRAGEQQISVSNRALWQASKGSQGMSTLAQCLSCLPRPV